MGKKFHINKHGVPATCNSSIIDCPYDVKNHFKTYDEAKDKSDEIRSEFIKGKPLSDLSPEKMIESYFSSLEAIYEFPINKKNANFQDFELIIISWLAKAEVKEGMKNNEIGNAKFTYGDIVRVVEQMLIEEKGYGLNLEDRYYNPIHYDQWDEAMKRQKEIYHDTNSLADKLGFESMEVVSLPVKARELLRENNFLGHPESLHEVIYKVYPEVSPKRNVITYNHNIRKRYKEFDIYEIAGAFEGRNLYDLCYSKHIEDKFEMLWESTDTSKHTTINYEEAVERYKREQFFKGIEGVDIPKAFVKMSPIVAREINNFIKRYRAIMWKVENILLKEGIDNQYPLYKVKDDEGDWIIEI